MVGEGGFEPPSADPESAVLPLDDSPVIVKFSSYTREKSSDFYAGACRLQRELREEELPWAPHPPPLRSAGISPGGLRSRWQTKARVVLLTRSLMLKRRMNHK
jgi:hypothetical protein